MNNSIACGVYSPAILNSLGRYAVRNAQNGRFTRSKAPTPVKAPLETEEPRGGQPNPLNVNHFKAAIVVTMLLLAVYNIIYVRFFYM